MAAIALGLALLAPAGSAPSAAASHVPDLPAVGREAPPTAPLPPPPGRTTLVSQRAGGGFPNEASAEPSISADGRYVAFASSASNIAGGAGPVAPSPAVFVRDRQRGSTIRLPLPPGVTGGGQARDPSIAADGSVVAFTYQPPQGFAAIGSYVVAWDRSTRRSAVVSRMSNGSPADRSREPSVSATGRFIAFTSENPNIAAGDGSNADIFRYDRERRKTVLVSVGFTGGPTGATSAASSISANGRLIAYVSDGGDVITHTNTGSGMQVYVRDMEATRPEQISVARGDAPNGAAGAPAISGNGSVVAFESAASNLVADDGNSAPDVYRRDRDAGETTLVSVTPDGRAGRGQSRLPSISADGRMVAFQSTADDLVALGAASADAHLAASAPTPLTEIYERDVVANDTVLVSVARNGRPAGKVNVMASVGGNGRFVAFASLADTLVANDRLGNADVFLRDMPPVPRLNPATIPFGSHAIGSTAVPGAATLVNTGWGPLAVRRAAITGAARLDYRVVADACDGRVLHRTEACTVSVEFVPRRQGARPATLAVPDSYTGSPRTAGLRGSGIQTRRAKLELDQEAGPPGTVVVATGSGFPSNAQVRLAWSQGITPKLPVIRADDRGRFRTQVLVFHNDVVGPRDLVATPVTASAFPPVSATMLVTRPSVAPPGFLMIRRVIDLPLVLLMRG